MSDNHGVGGWGWGPQGDSLFQHLVSSPAVVLTGVCVLRGGGEVVGSWGQAEGIRIIPTGKSSDECNSSVAAAVLL